MDSATLIILLTIFLTIWIMISIISEYDIWKILFGIFCLIIILILINSYLELSDHGILNISEEKDDSKNKDPVNQLLREEFQRREKFTKPINLDIRTESTNSYFSRLGTGNRLS